jgi:putative monooxygenase
MKLVATADDVQPITDKGGVIHILISPKTVGSCNLILGTATVPVGVTIKEHIHDYGEESFYVLRGHGQVHLANGETVVFHPGSAVRIPQGVSHSIENTSGEEILVVFATAPLAPTAVSGHRNLKGDLQ